MAMDGDKARTEGLIARFELERVLNQDQAGRRISLMGRIDAQPALLCVERTAFCTQRAYLAALPRSLAAVRALGANDVYCWALGRLGGRGDSQQGKSDAEEAKNDTREANGNGQTQQENGGDQQGNGDAQEADEFAADEFAADVKLNLIFPCTEAHIKKYSKQGVRLVVETAQTYREAVRPYMQWMRDEGRLNWVFNVLDGTSEAEVVIYRTGQDDQARGQQDGGKEEAQGQDDDEGFLLTPDLNWDRSTLEAMHLLALVERRDIWSLRDLKKKHIGWLEHMRAKIVAAAVATYPSIEADQLKLYVHYQPTYYHFHIHVVHVALEAGATQATGKAVGLDSIIETLRVMAGDDEAGMDSLTLSYTVGEASELWTRVFEPLKRKTSGQ